MKPIPAEVLGRFSETMKKRCVAVTVQQAYIKWLRYFLDYRDKYSLLPSGIPVGPGEDVYPETDGKRPGFGGAEAGGPCNILVLRVTETDHLCSLCPKETSALDIARLESRSERIPCRLLGGASINKKAVRV
jgi:hypothetical protein